MGATEKGNDMTSPPNTQPTETQEPLRAARVDAAQILEKQNRVAQLKSDITALELALNHTTIAAPTTSLIATLDVRSAGAVVQAG